MSPADYIAAASAAAAALSAIAGAIYVRGKLDAHAQAAVASLQGFMTAIKTDVTALQQARLEQAENRGGESARAEAVASLGGQVHAALERTAALEARHNAHEADCARRQTAIEKRLDRGEQLSQEIRDELRAGFAALGVAKPRRRKVSAAA